MANSDRDSISPKRRSARWWLALIIVAPFLARLFQVWFLRGYPLDFKLLQTCSVLRYAGVLLLVWAIFFSRLSWRWRFAWASAFVALTALAVFQHQARWSALTGERIPPGFKLDVWAAKPMIVNPVAFSIGDDGRVFVAETHRAGTSVPGIDSHPKLVEADLALRTVEDRVAVLEKYFSGRMNELTNESEIVRVLEDRAGKGFADFSAVYADGFKTSLDGVASGVLVRKDQVWFANIPELWLLGGPDGQGRAKSRQSLSHGYGVHIGYIGHDLHGLIFGPDGRLYFSMGDRGATVTTKEGKTLALPDEGAVFRCNPDGTQLELFCRGMRNPQELAFDHHGNLLTGDNDFDNGDEERLLYVVEGGDYGWRLGYQRPHLGFNFVPWMSEEIWMAHGARQADYNGEPLKERTPDRGRRPAAILPPIANIANGPGGLAYYPGTGMPAAFDNHFLLVHFTGSVPNSKIQSFSVKPKGAGFELADSSTLVSQVLATDVDFGPDGAAYFSVWGDGFARTEAGKLFRLYETNSVRDPLVLSTRRLLREGMAGRAEAELASMLSHPNRRVRQEAQFELAERGGSSIAVFATVARDHTNLLARLHAIWGLGQLGRQSPAAFEPLLPLLTDAAAEVRAQAANTLGDRRAAVAFGGLVKALQDESPRVRFFAATHLGKFGRPEIVPPVLEMLRANKDADAFLHHAGVMALVGLGDPAVLLAAAQDVSPAVRLAALLAMRKLESSDIRIFLSDADPKLVLEAARAINDTPIAAAQPALAALAKPTGLPDFTIKDGPAAGYDPLLIRAINAAFREGGLSNAQALSAIAAAGNVHPAMRVEALAQLSSWAAPHPRDRVMALYRPLPSRTAKPAQEALEPVLTSVLREAPDNVRIAAADAAGKLELAGAGAALLELAGNVSIAPAVSESALNALVALQDPRLPEAIKLAQGSTNASLRRAANAALSLVPTPEAVVQLARVIKAGSLSEKQGAFAALASMKIADADDVILQWLDLLLLGKVPAELRLDVLEAAARRNHPGIAQKRQEYRDRLPKDDALAGFRDTLMGGDAANGRRLFIERADTQCIRCHRVGAEAGGEVGPNLAGLARRATREYLLASIVQPSRDVAAGFENVTVGLKDGRSIAGVLKAETDRELSIFSLEDNGLVKVRKSEIATRVKGMSGMPEGLAQMFTLSELRDLMEFLATLK